MIRRRGGGNLALRTEAPAAARELENDGFTLLKGVFGPDESFIVLDVSEVDAESGAPGASDQWITFARDGTWTEPVRMGPDLNGEGYDNFTFFDPAGSRLYFVREFQTFHSVSLEAVLAEYR